MELTQERLKELVNYNPGTGVFSRIKSYRGCKTGDITESNRDDGYIRFSIDMNLYFAHRLAWFYTYGVWPKFIDHINGIHDDNRVVNLRSVSQSENNKNSSIRKDNKSGFIGVAWNKLNKNWRVVITAEGVVYNIGSFQNKDKAIEARKAANIKFGFHKNHGMR